MKIISSTDGKYVGQTIQDEVKIGDLISLFDFEFEVQYVIELTDNRISVGFPNYQLILEV